MDGTFTAQVMPEFLGDMGSKGCKHAHQGRSQFLHQSGQVLQIAFQLDDLRRFLQRPSQFPGQFPGMLATTVKRPISFALL